MDEIELKRARIVFIIGVIILLIAPFLLTRSFGLVQFDNSTGVIGDTIGGITSPIASLIGSLLVFYALRTQINANKIIFAQFEYQKTQETYRKLNQYIVDQIHLIREDISEYSITLERRQTKGDKIERQYTAYKGSEAVYNALEFYSKLRHESTPEEFLESNHNLVQLDLILDRIQHLFEEINLGDLTNRDKEYLENVVRYTYESKLRTILKQFEENRMSKSEPCSSCGKKHNGLPEVIFEKYDQINGNVRSII